ncbi:hypothetical protein ACFE04_001892 [Oxalis oulophora]
MDCSFGSGVDDFCVIKDQEMLDWVPPPGNWSTWGTTSPTRPDCQNVEHLSNETSVHEKDLSTCSSICEGFFDVPVNQSHGQPAYQFNPAKVEETDETFLNSLIEDQESENLYKSFCLSSEFSIFPPDDQSIDMIMGSESFSDNKHNMGSSNQLKTSVASLSMSCVEDEASASQSSSLYSEKKECTPQKVKPENVFVPSLHDISNGPKRSLEESIMQELETVMAKMTDKTRICFRDACYRLAQNSKEIMKNQNVEFFAEIPPSSSENHDVQLRTKKETELETNTIDRVVASLMFNKVDINLPESPIGESKSSRSKNETTGQKQNFSSHKRKMEYIHCSPTLTSNNEVRVPSEGFPKQTSNQQRTHGNK